MSKTPLQNTAEWESRCRRCGQCCHEKLDYDGRIYYTDEPCEYLDPKTLLCRVYADREQQRPGCVRLTADKVKKGFLPADCPYVEEIQGYVAPIMPDAEE